MSATTQTAPVRVCLCGCGGTTGRSFVPGHDARLVSQLGDAVARRELSVVEAMADATGRGVSQLLLNKLEASATRKLAEADEKAERKVKRDKEKAERASRPRPTREITFRLGRWSYTGRKVDGNDIEYTDNKGNTRRVDISKVKIAA